MDAVCVAWVRLLTMRRLEDTERLQVEHVRLQRGASWRWLVAVVTFVGGALLVRTVF